MVQDYDHYNGKIYLDIENLQREISMIVSAFSHMHVNNGKDDYCKQCGLYLTHPVHLRESKKWRLIGG